MPAIVRSGDVDPSYDLTPQSTTDVWETIHLLAARGRDIGEWQDGEPEEGSGEELAGERDNKIENSGEVF